MEEKFDKFRRVKNGKVIAVYKVNVKDVYGNLKEYKIYFKYRERINGDEIIVTESLVSKNGISFAVSNMQNIPLKYTDEMNVTYIEGKGEGEKIIKLWFNGNAEKFVLKLLDDITEMNTIPILKWLNSGTYKTVDKGTFKIID